MNELYSTLEQVLVRKIALYEDIIQVMNEEWASISNYSRIDLENAVSRKEILLAQVHDLNYKREEIVKAFAKSLNRSQSEVTLGVIIELKNNPFKNRMAACREKIKDQINTINQLNKANKQLINRSSLAMKKSMSWLYELDTACTSYYSNGQIREPVMESRVVNTDV
ncbi:MAG: flagellar protein FlgN [Nitrospinota bacterium]|nr:flagellar protein FlgN [Nitrospinota bacterium]